MDLKRDTGKKSAGEGAVAVDVPAHQFSSPFAAS
jgi:hypothetical protein